MSYFGMLVRAVIAAVIGYWTPILVLIIGYSAFGGALFLVALVVSIIVYCLIFWSLVGSYPYERDKHDLGFDENNNTTDKLFRYWLKLGPVLLGFTLGLLLVTGITRMSTVTFWSSDYFYTEKLTYIAPSFIVGLITCLLIIKHLHSKNNQLLWGKDEVDKRSAITRIKRFSILGSVLLISLSLLTLSISKHQGKVKQQRELLTIQAAREKLTSISYESELENSVVSDEWQDIEFEFDSRTKVAHSYPAKWGVPIIEKLGTETKQSTFGPVETCYLTTFYNLESPAIKLCTIRELKLSGVYFKTSAPVMHYTKLGISNSDFEVSFRLNDEIFAEQCGPDITGKGIECRAGSLAADFKKLHDSYRLISINKIRHAN